jgi:hypothetical protein
MRLVIARFRSRMAAANQKFLQDRINEIQGNGLAIRKRAMTRRMVSSAFLSMPEVGVEPESAIDVVDYNGLAIEEEKRCRLRQYKYMDNIKWDDEVPETCGSLICGSHSATEAGNGKAHGFLCVSVHARGWG